MTHMVYLQKYLEGLEHVPPHLQQEFKIMRDLDQKVQDILSEVQNSTSEFMDNVRSYTKEDRMQHLQNIQDLFKRGKELSNDKVSRAENAYELVDKQIRRLDADMFQFKKALAKEELKKRKRKAGADGNTHDMSLESLDEDNQNMPATAALALALTNNPSEVLDMPVDPNEPTYCLCHQVSYGEMVACDNRDCPVEWFHFGCVNLTSKPKGKWFCPTCSDEKRRKTNL